MPHRQTARSMQEALMLLRGSFLSFLEHAEPYCGPADADNRLLLRDLVERQNELGDRVAEFLRDSDEAERSGEFPAAFTDAHDLSIAYAMRRAAADQRRRVARLTELRSEAADEAAAELLDALVHETAAIADQLECGAAPAVAAS